MLPRALRPGGHGRPSQTPSPSPLDVLFQTRFWNGLQRARSKPCKRRAEGSSAFTVHDQAKERRVGPAESSVEPQLCPTNTCKCLSTHQCPQSHVSPFPDKSFIKNVCQRASRLRAEGAASCENRKNDKHKKGTECNKTVPGGHERWCAAHHARLARHGGGTSEAGAAVWPGSTVACMWCIGLGYKNCNHRLQAPICVHSSPFQRDTAVAGPWRESSCFTRGNHLSKKQNGNSDSATGEKPKRFLLEVLSSPKEGREPAADIRFTRSEQIHETVQFQDADTRRSCMLRAPGRLVHKRRSDKRLFPYLHLSPSQKISQVRLPGRNVHGCL